MSIRPRLVVAVDGPSGAGKSTVSRAVARRLALAYLDTGAMYRAVCLACLEAGVDPGDAAAVEACARGIDLDVGLDPDRPRVVLGGRDVTTAIRASQVSLAVSAVAGIPGVRAGMIRRQRLLIAAAPRGCVAEGRDITTVVAPDADVRILLTADAEARVARRARDLHGSDSGTARATTVAEVLDRDTRDSAVTAFLSPADDRVVVLDTSRLTLDETVATVVDLVEASLAARARA
ncbi:MAG: (d)CMP kinase [Kineosporiaceae bacterium]